MSQVRHENSDVREQERYRKSDLRHFCRTCKGGCWKKHPPPEMRAHRGTSKDLALRMQCVRNTERNRAPLSRFLGFNMTCMARTAGLTHRL